MRILWVKIGGLWPPTSGGRIRSLETLACLSRRHEVTLLTTHGPDDDPDGLARRLPHCHRVISVPFVAPRLGSASFAFALARSWVSSLPVDLWKWRVARGTRSRAGSRCRRRRRHLRRGLSRLGPEHSAVQAGSAGALRTQHRVHDLAPACRTRGAAVAQGAPRDGMAKGTAVSNVRRVPPLT